VPNFPRRIFIGTLLTIKTFHLLKRTISPGYSRRWREPVIAFSDRSVGAIQFYFRLVAVHDRYYLMVCTARALKGAPVVIRLVSRFNGDKEHRDAASGASPRTKRSLFSSKAASLRHRYSPTNSKLVVRKLSRPSVRTAAFEQQPGLGLYPLTKGFYNASWLRSVMPPSTPLRGCWGRVHHPPGPFLERSISSASGGG
jgi:hypothetical protein